MLRGKRGARALCVVGVCLAVVAAGVGGWKMFGGGGAKKPIVVGTTSTVTALDPAGAYDSGSWALFSNVFQSLLTFEPGSSEPVPDAAEHCEFTSSQLTRYSCTLRDGLRFSNGEELTAQDVRRSFQRVLDINHAQGPAQLFDTLESVTTRGGRVDFSLSSKDATFPLKIAGSAGAIVDTSSYPMDKLRTDGEVVGSGPFVLDEFDGEKQARLTPNSEYRGAQETPETAVTVRYFSDGEKLSSAWKARTIDVNDGHMPPEELATLNPSDRELELTEQAGTDTRMLVFNTRSDTPMSQRAVRQAVAAVVDRQGLAREVHEETVEPLYSLIPQGLAGHGTPFFDRYPSPDVTEARRLLLEAGVETPVDFDLAYDSGGLAEKEARELERQLNTTGLFRARAQGHEWEDFLKGFAEGAYDSYVVGWMPDFPDAETFTGSLVMTGNSLHNGYSSEQVDKLVAKTQSNPERSQTVEDFRSVHELIARDVPMLPLWQKKNYVLSRPEVAGAQYLSDYSGLWRLGRLERI